MCCRLVGFLLFFLHAVWGVFLSAGAGTEELQVCVMVWVGLGILQGSVVEAQHVFQPAASR